MCMAQDVQKLASVKARRATVVRANETKETEIMKRTDSQIQQAVLRELRWDTRVEETEIGVGVDKGGVTLTGTVSSWAKRVAAQEAAHRVGGVLDVANDIKVRALGTPSRSDTEIAHAVRTALEWNVFVPHKQITTTVSNGWITLDGEVDYWSEREDAEQAVYDLASVRGVTNKIRISSRAKVEDVQRAIEDALERRAEREARRIKLDVHDGKVSLSGVVHSWPERQAVIGAVRGTAGVRTVEDHLRISPAV